MQSSQIPVRIPTPFADQAADPTYRHQVPEASQIGITDGAASFVTGFPPLNFEPVASGGVPPFGNDMNGLLYQMTQWLRWMQAGGIVPWNGTFATAIGGYPLGAIVASATTAKKFWVSTAENNTQNPDTATPDANGNPSQWQHWFVGAVGPTAAQYTRPKMTVNAAGQITAIASGAVPTRTTLTSGSGTYTVPAGVTRIFVRMVGGGGGGGGTGAGGTGGTTSFNSVTAIGGSGGGLGNTSGNNGAGGDGGTGGTGSAWRRVAGAPGAPGCGLSASGSGFAPSGGMGGCSLLGPGGKAGLNGAAGVAAPANSGGGGGGRSVSGASVLVGAGGGGGAGEYVELQIAPTAASYSYAVGAAGAAGSGSGSAGGSGVIIIDEFYD